MEITEFYKKVEVKGRKIVPGFEMLEVYKILTEYFSKNEAFTDRGYSLDKGILLVGDVGTGKTVAFQVMRELLRGSKRFFMVTSSRQLIRDYTIDGAKVLNKWGRESSTPVYFDDLGLEEVNAKMYGNSANVMSEILLDRYDNFKRHGTQTHASSNLGAKEFEQIYGERMRDRMREMFNFIPITGQSMRK